MDNSHLARRTAAPRPSTVEGQLAFYGLDDPLWFPTLLAHLERGGVIIVERTGDLLILPGALDTRDKLNT